MLSAPAITDDFDWANNPDIVARHQDAIACYENLNGDVVIRREQSWCEDEDTIIVINKAHVPALVQALIDTAGLEGSQSDRDIYPRPRPNQTRPQRSARGVTAIATVTAAPTVTTVTSRRHVTPKL